MKGPLTLLAHSFRRVRTLVLATGVLLAAFQLLSILVAGSIERAGTFEQIGALMPPFIREFLGPSFGSFMSFQGSVCLGYFHPIVMGSLIAIAIALGTVLTGEVETGFMDLILSRPLARHWIITRSVVVSVACTIALLSMMLIGTWAGLATLAPPDAAWPSRRLVLSLAINLGLLMLGWGGIATMIGSVSRRRGAAGAAAGLLALGTILLDLVAGTWRPARSIVWLCPSHYFNPFEMLMGKSLPILHVAVLSGIAVASFATAYVLFSRRDITH